MRGEAGTERIAAVAARQHGVVTRAQALRHVSARKLDRLLAQGWLHRVHAGVYAVGHPALTQPARWLAATLALGPAATLSHRAAGALWGVLRGAEPLEVTVPTGRRHRDGVIVHRASVRQGERTFRHGIPVTTLVRTHLDLAAVLDARGLAGAFEEAQILHRLRPAVLAAELLASPRRRGAPALRALLEVAVDPGQVESILELRFLRLCAAHGLSRPLTQVRFDPWRVDFWFPDARVAVEADGARFHATAAKRARDARKTAALEAAGATVLRVTWADVTDRAPVVADRLRTLLAPAQER